jgi:hypothetical protein
MHFYKFLSLYSHVKMIASQYHQTIVTDISCYRSWFNIRMVYALDDSLGVEANVFNTIR